MPPGEGYVPPEYIFYQWRKLMNVGYLEMLNTPIEVIMRDLEISSIENTVENIRAKTSQNAKI